ncbi:hypothetical protein NBC122_00570 [Chryseobacterium salivictor]|uniref:Uncharacterized protein n=1 Tax=Chryseobacterium salivictor TaxID=2547600 RepID=A0A4P6ZDF2_9FLAO|nr:hypothetical protein NBC122_00570 [Chryseobacterium salivictor]
MIDRMLQLHKVIHFIKSIHFAVRIEAEIPQQAQALAKA